MLKIYRNYIYEEYCKYNDGMPIAVCSQLVLDVSTVNTLAALYDIYRRKEEAFSSAPDTTRD
jgi:hypothetical protein